MSTLVYLVAYAGILCCIGIIAMKVRNYLKKPVHVRWELYPVPHETGDKASYGGSYLEDVDWWKEKQKHSVIGGLKALLLEMLFMHCTFETQRNLWFRTYPFHLGLYLIIGGIFFTLITAVAQLAGAQPGVFLTALGNLVQVLSLLGFLGVIGGCLGLLHRRLTQPELKMYTSREHYLNLGAFLLFGVLGLLTWLSQPSFFALVHTFLTGLLSFTFYPVGGLFALFLLVSFVLAAYVPATHMAHFFMKYFLYHDIRWSDQPTQDNPAIQKKMGKVLGYPVGWKASHIEGDNKKTWAEVATTNPAQPKE